MASTPALATRLRPGDFVRVKPGIEVPEWTTAGQVVNPHATASAGDLYLHPSVRWEDGKTRPVPDSWLTHTPACPTCHRP